MELYAKDEKMSAYISDNPGNYHITCSYETAAKLTGDIDFSDMQPVEYSVTGIFGARLKDDSITYDDDW